MTGLVIIIANDCKDCSNPLILGSFNIDRYRYASFDCTQDRLDRWLRRNLTGKLIRSQAPR